MNRLAIKKIMVGLLLILAARAGVATAAQQQVTAAVVKDGFQPGDSITLDVHYATLDPLASVIIGLGLRLHWDSSRLSFSGLTSVLEKNLLLQGEPQSDGSDLDNDPATDTFINLFWVNFKGDWLATQAPPVRLYTIHFIATGVWPPGVETTLHFSASSLANGYTLQAPAVALPQGSPPDPDPNQSPTLFNDSFE
jgi:hypothetical protein